MLNACNRLAPLPLRLVFGAALAYHGFPKLFSPEGHASFRKIMETSGVPNPELAAWLIGLLEFGGGLGLIFGLFVRGLALAILIELSINLAIAATRGSFAPPQAGGQPLPDYESSLLYMGAMVALILTGAGPWSADSRRSSGR